MDREELVTALLSAPAGVALLAALEATQRAGTFRYQVELVPDPGAVRRPVAHVEQLSFGELAGIAVDVASRAVGPWTSGAADELAAAYRGAEDRAELAEAVAARFAEDLEAPCDVSRQEIWLTAPDPVHREARRLFTDLTWTYDRGEFPWTGLRAVTAPPVGCHDELIQAWELYGPPISRWHIPASEAARIWEIHRPSDWVRLVETYPQVGRKDGGSWEVPGVNQFLDSGAILEVPGQHGARATNRQHLVPDWVAVSHDYDAVHVSWAGFVTAEGFVSDLPHNDTAMLRFWSSERTCWLRDVFDEPQPLPGPVLQDSEWSADATTDPSRQAADRHFLNQSLGR